MAFIMAIIAFLGLLFFYRTIVLGWPLAVKSIYLVCWVVFPAILGFFSWVDYGRIVIAEPQTVPPKPEDWSARATLEYQLFLNLSVPRRVFISWKGWLRINIGVICCALICYLAVPPTTVDFVDQLFQKLKADALPVGILLLIGGWTNLNLVRQRWSHVPLLKSGIAVVGRVAQQQFQNVRIGMDMIGRYSLVQYEFHDRLGLPVSGGGHDYSKTLYQEMPALIFYEETDPSQNVALGCSLYEVKDK